jgi:hypothetical protein
MTEAEFQKVIREYHDLAVASQYRKLSDKDRARMYELEAKLEAIV